MPDVTQRPSVKHGQISLFHIAVVSLSLLLTISAWQFAKYQAETRTEARFHAGRDQAIGLIADRMTKYEDALWAGVAAVQSHSADISLRDWQVFSRNLRIDERYPGINGIGVIHFHTEGTVDGYVAEQRRSRPGFRVFPAHDNPVKMPITLIEPSETNAAAVGLDVAHETNRRTAALAARDTGTAQITGPIVLVQDEGQTPGFLFYAPFYAGGEQRDPADRQQNFLGAVYAPFVVHKLMDGLLSKELRGIHFSIRDGDQFIYDEHSVDDTETDPNPMFTEQVALDLYGRTWTLDMRTNMMFRQENTAAKPTLILVGGLIIELLIISLLYMMSQANKRAVSYADRVTAELRDEKSKLVSTNAELHTKNEELERFVFVASHDLKTPLRGISGLTEMVKEDLEDYLSSPEADPQVGRHLDMIQGRVERMDDLIAGVLKLSQVDASKTEDTQVALGEIVEDLKFDFGLQPEQLRLNDGGLLIGKDSMNFRTVLENLIGNAIKYHNGEDALRIDVSAIKAGDTISVSVSDNGPGVDPRFHDRIFEMFQTLRAHGDDESSGIGLSIVKKAVERHGGKIKLVSSPGKGATFHFDWPDPTSGRSLQPSAEAA